MNLETINSAQWQSDNANWLITMSDLSLLLVCFLVLWYVVTSKKSSVDQAKAAVQQVSQQGPKVKPLKDNTTKAAEWAALQNEMTNHIRELGLGNDVLIESAANEMIVSLKDTVPFASGKADLRQQALPVLEKVVSMVLRRSDIMLEITGHTDSLPIATAEFPSNWELSTARASRVARYLVERGIHPSRVAVQGYANHRPVAPNTTAGDRKANRRVEIRLYRQTATSGEQ